MRLPAVHLLRVIAVALCGGLGISIACASPGGSGGGHSSGGHGAAASHAAGNLGAAGGQSSAHSGPRPGQAGSAAGSRGSHSACGWHGRGGSWGGAGYAVAYAPEWWSPMVPFYQDLPNDAPDSTPLEAAPAEAAAPVSYRFFCPSSSSYYPEVPTCAVPWLRVVVDR